MDVGSPSYHFLEFFKVHVHLLIIGRFLQVNASGKAHAVAVNGIELVELERGVRGKQLDSAGHRKFAECGLGRVFLVKLLQTFFVVVEYQVNLSGLKLFISEALPRGGREVRSQVFSEEPLDAIRDCDNRGIGTVVFVFANCYSDQGLQEFRPVQVTGSLTNYFPLLFLIVVLMF